MATRDDQSSEFLNSDALGNAFFIDIVERKLGLARGKFELGLVLIAPATGKNENYLSVVYRAKIKVKVLESGEGQIVDVIIKAMLSTMPELKEWSVFPREIFMYSDVINSFERIWEERAGEIVVFGPRCLKVTKAPYEVVVLDDLKAEGYQMLNRKIGMDEKQAKLVLSKLAKFHAASAIRHEQEGEISSHLDRGSYRKLFSTESPFYSWYVNALKSFTEVVRESQGCEKIAEKISTLDAERVMLAYFAPMKPLKCGLRVLNHGDDWINNLMVAGKDDVKFLDFQNSYWGSPSGDLLYFLLTSVSDDVKVEKFDEFVKHYHEELIESLLKLSYNGALPTLEEIHEDFVEKKELALSVLIDIMFICKHDSHEELTLEQFTDPTLLTAEMMTSHYRNPNYLKALTLWLPFFETRSLLDF